LIDSHHSGATRTSAIGRDHYNDGSRNVPTAIFLALRPS
jgi:hypothetical protein